MDKNRDVPTDQVDEAKAKYLEENKAEFERREFSFDVMAAIMEITFGIAEKAPILDMYITPEGEKYVRHIYSENSELNLTIPGLNEGDVVWLEVESLDTAMAEDKEFAEKIEKVLSGEKADPVVDFQEFKEAFVEAAGEIPNVIADVFGFDSDGAASLPAYSETRPCAFMPTLEQYKEFYSFHHNVGSGHMCWLDTCAGKNNKAAVVNPTGGVNALGFPADFFRGGHRPAIIIERNSLVFKKLEKLCEIKEGAEFTIGQKYDLKKEKYSSEEIHFRIEKTDEESIIIMPAYPIAFGPFYKSGEYQVGECLSDEVFALFEEEFCAHVNDLPL